MILFNKQLLISKVEDFALKNKGKLDPSISVEVLRDIANTHFSSNGFYYEYKVEDLNLLKLTLEKTRDEYKDKTKKVQFYKIFNNCMTYCYIPVDQDYLIKGAKRAIMLDYLEDDSEFLNNELVINIEIVEISVNSINEIYPIVDSPEELESFL